MICFYGHLQTTATILVHLKHFNWVW